MISMPPYFTRQNEWDSDIVLAGLSSIDMADRVTSAALYQDVIWNDLCSEYDSLFFLREVRNSNITISSEFADVLDSWRHDEHNHYRGLKRVYSLLYGSPLDGLEKGVSSRKPDFSALSPFFTSELSMCLLLAFDEIATVRSYAKDFAFYDSFEIPALSDWIRKVVRDESAHFNDFVSLIGRRHARAAESEAEQIVQAILCHDVASRGYGATFVLDHTGPQFTKQFLEECAAVLMRTVGYRLRQCSRN